MKRQLVFIPVAADELGVLVGDPPIENRPAYTVTPDLLAELGYAEAESEDAEYAALILASVAGLAAHGVRLVVVAEVEPSLIEVSEDPANGEVLLLSCPTSSMTAWFAEEPGVDVTDAAAMAHGLTIDLAWDLPQVQDLLQEHELLWNDVVEYRRGA